MKNREFEYLSINWHEFFRRNKVFKDFIETDKSEKWKCRICDNWHSYNQFSRHLKELHGLTAFRYYFLYVDTEPQAEKCLVNSCHNSVCSTTRLSHGMNNTCGDQRHIYYFKSCRQSMTMERLNTEWWANSEYRQKMLEQLKQQKLTSESVSESNKRRWKDPEYRKQRRLTSSKAFRRICMYGRPDDVQEKTLYCLKVSDDKIKLGISSTARFGKLAKKFPCLFTVTASKSVIFLAEYELLEMTESYFVEATEEEYASSNCGTVEIRHIDCLPLVIEYLEKRGAIINYENT